MNPLKGFEAIELATLFSSVMFFFKELDKDPLNADTDRLYESIWNRFWLFKFEKQDIELVLSFFVDGNGIPLHHKGLVEFDPVFLKEKFKEAFDAIAGLNVYVLDDRHKMTFRQAIEVLLVNYKPSDIELKDVFSLMG